MNELDPIIVHRPLDGHRKRLPIGAAPDGGEIRNHVEPAGIPERNSLPRPTRARESGQEENRGFTGGVHGYGGRKMEISG